MRWLVASLLAVGLGPTAMAEDAMFRAEITLSATPEAVWTALTEKSVVDRYYLAPLIADVTGAGDRMAYGTQNAAMIEGSVLTYEPPYRLVHSFAFVEPSGPGPVSEVTYRLAAQGDETRLAVEHRGYAEDSQPYADISMGWPIILDGLKSVVETK
ncbi:MAG: SRPBCC domain-containing protein [Pseudomonadota bacterium]